MNWCCTVDCRWDNGGFQFQEVEYASVLPLYRLLILFFLCGYADFLSMMALCKIGKPDCTTIYMAVTIRTHCMSRKGIPFKLVLVILSISTFIPGNYDTYCSILTRIHISKIKIVCSLCLKRMCAQTY